MPIKSKENRFNCSELAITWPQCELKPSDVWANILASETVKAMLVKCCITSEHHKDGHRHLHAYFLYSKKVKYAFSHMDGLVGKRGHYQRVRIPFKWKKYIIKEVLQDDAGDWLHVAKEFSLREPTTFADWNIGGEIGLEEEDRRKNSRGQASIVMSLIKENPCISIREIERHLDPAFYYREHRRIADILCAAREEMRMAFNQLAFDEGIVPFTPEMEQDTNVRHILTMLNTYFLAIGGNPIAELPPKGNVICLWGEAGMHKSGIHRHFAKYVPTIGLQMNKEFMFNGVQLRSPPRVVVVEQFRGLSEQFPYSALELFLDCDGSQVFNAKGSSLHLPLRPLFIICTNTPPAQWYAKKIGRQNWDGSVAESYECELGNATRQAMYSRLKWCVNIKHPAVGFPNPDINENTIILPDFGLGQSNDYG